MSCSRVFVNVSGPEKYSFYYDTEEFFFQLFGNVLPFKEIFEDVVICGH